MHCTYTATVALPSVMEISDFPMEQLLAFPTGWVCFYVIFLYHSLPWVHLSWFPSIMVQILCRLTRLQDCEEVVTFLVYFLCLGFFSCFYDKMP